MRISDWSSDVCSSDLADALADLHRAADIAGRDDVRVEPREIGGLAVAELTRDLGLEDIVRARRAAAQMRFGGRAHGITGIGEQPRRRGGDFLPVLERTGGVIGDREPAARSEEHTSELQSLMRTSVAVFSLKKK